MKSEKKNFVEKIINSLLNVLIIIFGIILLISIYTGVQTKILGNNYTNFFGYSIFEVQTGSMADTINAGDVVIVKLTKKVKLNDVVTYKLDGEYITHRIIEVYNNRYVTKGDANNAKDDPINQNQVVGKVVKTLANFGILRRTLFNPSVLIALIVTLFLVNLAFKKNKSSKEESDNSITKKVSLFFETIINKISLIFKKFMKSLKNKKSNINSQKIEKNYTIPKIDNKPIELEKISSPINVDDKTRGIDSTVKDGDYYKDEDELEKTSFFRMIPVDSNEVGDKYKKAPTKEEVEDYYKDEDELDKTSLFRIIPVDASEVGDTFLEIAKNEMTDTKQKGKNKEEEEQKPEEVVEEKEDLTNINLELLKNKSRKGKNVIDTVMLIRKEEISELIDVLVKDDKTYINKETIKDEFITTYIDAKYYNYYGEKNTEYLGKNSVLKIEKVIKEVARDAVLFMSSNDNKSNEIVDRYTNIFILIANLEQAKDSITDSKVKNEFYKKEIKKYAKDWNSSKVRDVIDEIIKIQKSYADTIAYFLKKLETSMFDLSFNKLSTKEDMYGLELKHNISFSKVYSDYIIDKTYTEGIVAEDKISVLITMLLIQVVKDMSLSNFNRKYILYVPESLYDKERKFEKMLKMFDDKYAKDNIIILLKFEDLLNNKAVIKKVRKMGYKFALVFDKDTVIEEKDRGEIYISDYIFVNKKVVDMVKIRSFIPEELSDKIIYEDIVDKVGDFGSD